MLLSSIALALSMAMFQAPQPSSGDLASAYKELQGAEEKKDADLIKKWAVETLSLGRASMKAPPDQDAEVQKSRLQFAKEVMPHAEYALAGVINSSSDNKAVIELHDTLAEASPDSKYLGSTAAKYIEALGATGNEKKVFPFAEKAIAKDPNNEALLVVLADGYFSRKNWAQAASYGSKLATASKRPQLAGRGYFLAGQAYAALNRHAQADKALRAALPNIKSETALYAPALFQLGISDYNLARLTRDRVMMKDAIAYSEECSKLNNPVAGQAAQNAFTMKKELATFR
jgi:tetratricopeptide (TPR) repeat protein